MCLVAQRFPLSRERCIFLAEFVYNVAVRLIWRELYVEKIEPQIDNGRKKWVFVLGKCHARNCHILRNHRQIVFNHPPLHFHAVYGEQVGIFSIDRLEMTESDLPQKPVNLVCEWVEIHQSELKVTKAGVSQPPAATMIPPKVKSVAALEPYKQNES